MPKLPYQDERTHLLLLQMADKLGLPVAAFYDDAPGEAGELLTLMRLWSAIEDGKGRQRVFALAKQEFERSRGHERSQQD